MCFKFELTEGKTLFLPAGWIHAVLSPKSTIAIGGIFLHCTAIPRQLQVYNLVCKMTDLSKKYLFPNFKEANFLLLCLWFTQSDQLGRSFFKEGTHILDFEGTLTCTNYVYIKFILDQTNNWLNLADFIEICKTVLSKYFHALDISTFLKKWSDFIDNRTIQNVDFDKELMVCIQ
jgi:hypothetical protein